jgi:uncharacterized membrane protein required for colicin V production
MTSYAMIASGIVLIVGSLIGALTIVGLVAGLLLIWSGIVKVIVLRIWRASLAGPDSANGEERTSASKPALRLPT